MDYRSSEHLIPVFDYGVLHLELNTALFILVLFLIVMFAMNRLLFRPVLSTLDNRQALLDQLAEQAESRSAEIASMDERYREDLARVRSEAAEYRQEQRRLAGEEAAAILATARKEAEGTLNAAMGKLEGEIAQAREEVMAGVSPLAQRITDRILER